MCCPRGLGLSKAELSSSMSCNLKSQPSIHPSDFVEQKVAVPADLGTLEPYVVIFLSIVLHTHSKTDQYASYALRSTAQIRRDQIVSLKHISSAITDTSKGKKKAEEP
jgi:hypothetical protein